MSADDNLQIIRRLYEAFATGDGSTFASTFAADVVWHEGGIHSLAGTYHGVAGVMAVNGGAAELTNGTLAVEVHDILASEDHVVVLQRVTASREDRNHALDEVLVIHLAQGQVTEVWVSYPDPAAAAALFGESGA